MKKLFEKLTITISGVTLADILFIIILIIVGFLIFFSSLNA